MTRDEWNAYIAVAPATPYQRGRIMAECIRLGLTGRAERLAICAQIAGLKELDSTRDLVQGDAGRIVGTLLDVRDRAELLAAAGLDEHGHAGEHDKDQAAGPGEQAAGPTLGDAIRQLVLACLAWLQARDGRAAAEPAVKRPGD